MNTRPLLLVLPPKLLLRQTPFTNCYHWRIPLTQSRHLSRYPHSVRTNCTTTIMASKSMKMSTSSSPSSEQHHQQQQQWRQQVQGDSPKKCPNLTLYGDLNMRPFRNIWMLEETNLPYSHVPCRPRGRKATSIHPLGKVPSLLVEFPSDIDENSGGVSVVGATEDGGPTKGDNTLVVLESAAINTYLGDLARELQAAATTPALPTKNNYNVLVPPPATPQRAKYDSLAFFIMTELDAQSLWIHRKHDDLKKIFGDAPTAVKEARRQFDNAMGVMLTELKDCAKDCDGNSDGEDDDDSYYLIPSFGFSAADILFVHCCNWAQQIGWLEKMSMMTPQQPSPSSRSESKNHAEERKESSGVAIVNNDDDATNEKNNEVMVPYPLTPHLEEYLRRCRSRPAFGRTNVLRKNQQGTAENSQSKL